MFSLSGRREKEPGFLRIYGSMRDDEVSDVPVDLEVGKVIRVASLKQRQGATSAPGFLTESDLIEKMEKHGIGTDASIPTHINNIIVRNYVQLGQGRTLIPTQLGIVLVHGYQRIDPQLVLPDTRAAIEASCDRIARGQAMKETVRLNMYRSCLRILFSFVSFVQQLCSILINLAIIATTSTTAASSQNNHFI